MKKKYRNLLFAILALILLICVYYFLSRLPQNNSEPEVTPAPTAVDTSVKLFSAEKENLKEIHIANPTEKYTYVKNDGKWTIKEYPGVEFNMMLELTAGDFASVSAMSLVEDNSARLLEFGLDRENASFTVVLNDNSEKTFLLGNKVPGREDRYLRIKDEQNVYIYNSVSAAEIYKTPKDFRDKKITSGEIADTINIKLTGKNGVTVFDIEKKPETEANPYTVPFVMKEPYRAGVITETFEAFVNSVLPMDAVDFYKTNPSDKDLAEYNLLNPEYILDMTNSTTLYTISISKGKDGNIYAAAKDKNFVFSIKDEVYEAVSKADAYNLLEKFAHLYIMDDINSINIKDGSTVINLSVKRDNEGVINEYTVNDRSFDEKKFKGVYEKLISISLSGVAEKPVSSAAKVSFEVTYKDGERETVEYIDYDERNYALSKNGVSLHTVLKNKIDEFVAALKEAMQ